MLSRMIRAKYDGSILKESGDFSISIWRSSDYAALPDSIRPAKEEKKGAKIIVKGFKVPLHKGILYELHGEWKTDKQGRISFESKESVPVEPDDSRSRISYLSCGLIRGISKKHAILINERFGSDTFKVLQEAPDLLLDIPGIGEKRLELIKESYQKTRFVQALHQLLGNDNISLGMTEKILKGLGEDAIEKIKDNPYVLTEVVEMDFQVCDAVAYRLNCDPHSGERLKAALYDTLCKGRKMGHLFLPRSELLAATLKTLNRATNDEVSFTELSRSLDIFLLEKIFYDAGKERIYPMAYAYMEMFTASKLIGISKIPIDYNASKYSNVVNEVLNSMNFQLESRQIQAVKWGLVSRIMVLTGGPGTGKTTTLNTLLKCFKRLNPGKSVYLLAPTGRAARRAAQATGQQAYTIDKILTVLSSATDDFKAVFQNGFIICDEFSMVDTEKLFRLCTYLNKNSHFLMVGDPDQLPSVGPGDCLRQIIYSGCLRTIRLNCVKRQGEGSPVITNANKINTGDTDLVFCNEFQFVEAASDDECVKKLLELYQKYTKIYGVDKVALLTPRRQRSIIGCEKMNEAIKPLMSSYATLAGAGNHKNVVHANGCDFMIGDRIIENKNSDKASNGDVGNIKDIHYVEEDGNLVCKISISYDDIPGTIEYTKEEMDTVSYGWCYTIHKSQGSEYPVVISPVMESDKCMLKRNLLYTAVTRGQMVVLVGMKDMLSHAIMTVDTGVRNTLLAEFIRKVNENPDSILLDEIKKEVA